MESSVALYLEKQASAHRLDARSKIGMLAVYSVGIFFVDTWLGMAAYAAMFVAALAFSGVSARRVFTLVVPVYVIAALTVFFNMFQASYAGLAFAVDGLVRGCFFAFRILLLVWASLILSFNVSSIELTGAFGSILSPLRHIKVPVDDIATVFSIAVRFIPQMSEEFFCIRDAQWSRGARFNDGPAMARVKAYCMILVPMIIRLFRRADKLALSMDARCYGARGVRRTDIRATSFGEVSAAALLLVTIACIAISAGL